MSWQPVDRLDQLGAMAFDHARILQDGVERARAKLEYTSLGAAFCGAEFTIAELRRVYEIVWGTPLDPRNFHRKVTGAERFLVETGSASSSGGRPAQLYRRGDAELLHPPMLRPAMLRPAMLRPRGDQTVPAVQGGVPSGLAGKDDDDVRTGPAAHAEVPAGARPVRALPAG
jgi:8-oxo-dGTP diphosphatase